MLNPSREQQKQLANAIRILAMDAVEQAQSGHPGMPLGMADIAEVLFRRVLTCHPLKPHWPNRDRFVLSNGHGVMLLYAVLHLMGFELSLDDIKRFRQLHSNTPGHPEYGITPGVESTTGPLGQGLGQAVGMALGSHLLAQQYNRPGFPIIDHQVYAFVGDGCLMEGVSHEVASLAGTWGLGRLIVFWDNNGISIDGEVSDWLTEDIPARFRAYGFQVIDDIDGHDPNAIAAAIQEAKQDTQRPSLLCCRTQIGYGSPKAGQASCHGAPLGAAAIKETRANLGWTEEQAFAIPAPIYAAWNRVEDGEKAYRAWERLWQAYKTAHPDLATSLEARWQATTAVDTAWSDLCQTHFEQAIAKPSAQATRKASQQLLTALASACPALILGSADLGESTGVLIQNRQLITKSKLEGNYLHYGVREFGMNTILCGLALYGGFIPCGSTFLSFADYGKPAIRLAAMMKQKVIFVFSHDSIGLGEDGPTHQPVEQLGMLRLIPHLQVIRPGDTAETAVAWQLALTSPGPVALILSRQSCPPLGLSSDKWAIMQKGAYILWETQASPEIILMASGSELSLALKLGQALAERGWGVRVISCLCWEQFQSQDKAYQDNLLPPQVKKRVYIEASASWMLKPWVGEAGLVFGVDDFGHSAPGDQVFAASGLTVERLLESILQQWA